MSNRYKTRTPYNPLPFKTYYNNAIEWSSIEEAIGYYAEKRVRRSRSRHLYVKMEVKED